MGRLGTITWGGLVFGPGSRYPVTDLTGLDDLPEIRSSDLARASQHGDFSGADYAAARTVQIGLGLRGDRPEDLDRLARDLVAVTQPQQDTGELVFTDQGLMVRGKVRRRAIPYDAQHLWSTGTAAVEWYCPDPRVYSATEHTARTRAYSPAGGRSYDLVFDRRYGGAGTSGRLVLANAGSSEAWPRLKIRGPVVRPSVEWATGGLTLLLDATLQAGEVVEVDTFTRAVLYQGTAPRPAWVRRGPGFGWPRLLPGSNEFVFRGSALAGAESGAETTLTTLTVAWRDTSL